MRGRTVSFLLAALLTRVALNFFSFSSSSFSCFLPFNRIPEFCWLVAAFVNGVETSREEDVVARDCYPINKLSCVPRSVYSAEFEL